MPSLEETTACPGLQEQIIDALRAELQEYGGLLNLFDEQQDSILHRKPDAVLAIEDRIAAQLGEVRARRSHREVLVATLAKNEGATEATTMLKAIPLFREATRPLVDALTIEVNRLITKVRRRAQQNQMLLARSIEVTQEVLRKMNPGAITRTYAPNGSVKIKARAEGGRLLEHS